MKTDFELLSSTLKTAQMGQVGIRAVSPYAIRSDLKRDLHDQLMEYHTIEKDAYALAAARGWEMQEINGMSKAMSQMYAKANLCAGNKDSRIAAMMIQGNTRGMIKGTKNLHHRKGSDAQIGALSQKLLDIEHANIKQMQGYL